MKIAEMAKGDCLEYKNCRSVPSAQSKSNDLPSQWSSMLLELRERVGPPPPVPKKVRWQSDSTTEGNLSPTR
jgi:hypothetical protein